MRLSAGHVIQAYGQTVCRLAVPVTAAMGIAAPVVKDAAEAIAAARDPPPAVFLIHVMIHLRQSAAVKTKPALSTKPAAEAIVVGRARPAVMGYAAITQLNAVLTVNVSPNVTGYHAMILQRSFVAVTEMEKPAILAKPAVMRLVAEQDNSAVTVIAVLIILNAVEKVAALVQDAVLTANAFTNVMG